MTGEKNIRLRTGKKGVVKPGHPWIFKSQILKSDPTIKPGDIISVTDSKGKKEGYYNIGAISFGLSFGGEKKSIVIAFMTDDALKNFKEGSGWTIGGEGSLAVITVGAGYEGSVATVNKPIIAFVFGEKGLMYDLSLNGSKVSKIDR